MEKNKNKLVKFMDTTSRAISIVLLSFIIMGVILLAFNLLQNLGGNKNKITDLMTLDDFQEAHREGKDMDKSLESITKYLDYNVNYLKDNNIGWNGAFQKVNNQVIEVQSIVDYIYYESIEVDTYKLDQINKSLKLYNDYYDLRVARAEKRELLVYLISSIVLSFLGLFYSAKSRTEVSQ